MRGGSSSLFCLSEFGMCDILGSKKREDNVYHECPVMLLQHSRHQSFFVCLDRFSIKPFTPTW